MEFKVCRDVLDSGVKIVFAVVEGMDNHGVNDEWQAYRTARISQLYEEYRNIDVHADPVLEGFNILHDNVGVKRRKNIPASENWTAPVKTDNDKKPLLWYNRNHRRVLLCQGNTQR